MQPVFSQCGFVCHDDSTTAVLSRPQKRRRRLQRLAVRKALLNTDGLKATLHMPSSEVPYATVNTWTNSGVAHTADTDVPARVNANVLTDIGCRLEKIEFLLSQLVCSSAQAEAFGNANAEEDVLAYLQIPVAWECDLQQTPMHANAPIFVPTSVQHVGKSVESDVERNVGYRNWCPCPSKFDILREGSAGKTELRTEAACVLQRFVRKHFTVKATKALAHTDGNHLKANPCRDNAEPWLLVEEAAEQFPDLAKKWTRYISTINNLPAEAFSGEQRPWLAKLFYDHTLYSSLALQVSVGYVNSRKEVFEALALEMQRELADKRDSPWNSEASVT